MEVTLATGRAFRATRRVAEELEVNAPLICYQSWILGAVGSSTGRPSPLSVAQEMVRFARERGLHLNVYLDDNTYVERITPETEFYAQISGVPVYPVGDLLAFLREDPTKLVIISRGGHSPRRLQGPGTGPPGRASGHCPRGGHGHRRPRLRKKYNIEPGSMVELVDAGGKIIIFPTVKDPIGEARGMLAGGASLTQELLAERAKDLEREEAEIRV